MSEVIPIRPVVEVRETFTPSERLRDAMVDFLDPNLDDATKESLRAAFLFKSWRRRVMEKEQYLRERNGAIHDASLRFGALPPENILLYGAPGFDSRAGRIIIRSRPSRLVVQAYDILNSIPTIEAQGESLRETALAHSNLFYTDIAIRSLASAEHIVVAKHELHMKTIHPATKNAYYLMPDQIVIRDTMARTRPSRSEEEYR